jgi:hypothetical protein
MTRFINAIIQCHSMEKHDAIFSMALLVSLFFFASMFTFSLTGNAISETLVCQDGKCYGSCDSDSDCYSTQCCIMGMSGICTSAENCMAMQGPDEPRFDIEVYSPSLESPVGVPGVEGVEIATIGLCLTLGIGITYLMLRKKSLKKS